MSFPQNVTTILLCNSELIKSNQNSLYHFLREVTSFILFPFNLISSLFLHLPSYVFLAQHIPDTLLILLCDLNNAE